MESNENNPAENLDVNKPQEVVVSEASKETTPEISSESTIEVVEVTEKFVPESRLKLQKFQDKVAAVKTETQKMVIGQHELVDQIILAIFAGGHVLLEGVPGIAKTLTAKVISKTLSVAYSRIQFTPDLMPSDVLGTSVFNVKTSEFTYKKGPIFSNIVLIDEINRSPAKTQAALFEVMEERQITNDGQTFKMEPPFFIIATQNPIEQEGTYRLPEAQLDRFLFRIKLEYPSIKDEIKILHRFKHSIKEVSFADVNPVLTAADIEEFQGLIESVKIEDQLIEYIAKIVAETRNHAMLYLGASPRASLSILKAAKTTAAIRGRDFVTPDDIQYVSEPVMNHRIILTPEAEMEGVSAEDVIAEIVQKIEVPR
ncbi:MoxR family ATPase [Flavobacteriales bacterium]|nr:MoxR family ATPase [Flavobacteriales bacterium]